MISIAFSDVMKALPEIARWFVAPMLPMLPIPMLLAL